MILFIIKYLRALKIHKGGVMKKLLIILTLGLMFGQTEIQTRFFSGVTFSYDNNNILDFGDILDGLENAYIEIVNVDFEYSNTQSGSN